MSEDSTKIDPIDKFRRQKLNATKWIFIITLGVILVFGALGHIFDQIFDTKPWFLMSLIILSFPVTQIIIHKKIKRELTKNV